MNRVPNVDRYKLAGDESGRLGVDGTQSGDETYVSRIRLGGQSTVSEENVSFECESSSTLSNWREIGAFGCYDSRR